jgi:hypothetical protein
MSRSEAPSLIEDAGIVSISLGVLLGVLLATGIMSLHSPAKAS